MSSNPLDTDFAFDTPIQEEEPEAVPTPTIPLTREQYQNEEMHYMRTMLEATMAKLESITSPPPPPPSYHAPPIQPNLNLPTPPQFSGTPSELHVFHLKMCQYLIGNQYTYSTAASQIMYAGSLLIGPAGQWYASLVDMTTIVRTTSISH